MTRTAACASQVLLGSDGEPGCAQGLGRHALAVDQLVVDVDLMAAARGRPRFEYGLTRARGTRQVDRGCRAARVRSGDVAAVGRDNTAVGSALGSRTRRGQSANGLGTDCDDAVVVGELHDRRRRAGFAAVIAAHSEKAGGYNDRGLGATTVAHWNEPTRG